MPNRHLNPHADSDLAPLLADFFEASPASVQTGLVNAMLKPVGPLAMVAVAAGAFARFLPAGPAQALEVTTDSVRSISPEQMFELTRYVEQKSPELLSQLPDLVGGDQAWMASASGALLLTALRAMPKL